MLRTSRVFFVLFTLLLMLVMAGGAFAQSFEIIWDSPLYGYGSGVFAATNSGEPAGTYLLTSGGGTQAGIGISLLGTIPGYGSNDNLIYPGSTPVVDLSGFSFTDGVIDYNISYNPPPNNVGLVECSSVTLNNPTCYYTLPQTPLTYLKINATPEPSTILLFLSGFGVLLILAGRKLTT
jgi:hypothetical protein